MLEHAFMQRALVAAVLVGGLCGPLGFFVVLRRLAFVGVGISHAAVGGVALGLLLGWPPLAAAGALSAAVALGIAAARRRPELGQDAMIGALLSGAMALGVVLLSARRGYQADLFGYLFGNVLAVSAAELAALAALAAGVLAVLALSFRAQLFAAFDEEVARAYGHPVERLEAALLLCVAAVVVASVRLVGVLLVEALLVVPAATAALWAPHYRGQIALATGLAVTSGIAGLALAWQLDVAPGATIALLAVALFLGSLALRGARR